MDGAIRSAGPEMGGRRGGWAIGPAGEESVLSLVGRTRALFQEDIAAHEGELRDGIGGASFLVLGGAGSIGQAVVKEIFRRNPRVLHVVDLSENNLVELVRDLRSSLGYIEGDFKALPLDCGSPEFDAFLATRPRGYDYVLNLSALKHVRSEKDPWSLMRMVQVNILNNDRATARAAERGARKFFCVSTDKASNPVNMMGASKRIMELFLMRRSLALPVSSARFANVAFSDGSLLHGFNLRMQKRQPLAAPRDVRRYFVTPRESGELCLLSCLLGENREIFFPKPSAELNLVTFASVAERYLEARGLKARPCRSEEEARGSVEDLAARGEWPCWFFDSDTTGEKACEEFYTEADDIDLERFHGVGVIRNRPEYDGDRLAAFESGIAALKAGGSWSKSEVLDLFLAVLPDFEHEEKGKYLDDRM